MGLFNVFKAPIAKNGTVDGKVSDFLTTQSLTNFTAMTGVFTVVWNGLQRVWPWAGTLWVPYILSWIWAGISILISLDALKSKGAGAYVTAAAIAFLNSLVLAGAVVGTSGLAGKLATYVNVAPP